MEEQLKEKKIRWNISKAMSAVYQSLNDSKLRIKKTKAYSAAMDNLRTLYNLNQTQVWILCIACERYFECEDSITFKNISSELDVPVMSIISWKKEIEFLIEHGFLEHSGRNGGVQPINDFSESIYNNTEYIPQAKKEDDDIDFISYMADCYELRRCEDMSARSIQRELRLYERAHTYLDVVKRVSAELENPNYRFFVYDVASDVLKGGDSNLNATISDLYDGGERYNVAIEMMEEKHELFQKGLVEFVKKGNLSDAAITLSDKGRKLVLGEKAFLFEDSINDKNLIKTDSIKEKKLFYSPENQKEIDRLKEALQEEKLKGIQRRLKDDGLPVGVAVLLYGAPGTGKTESVMQIAKETGRSIIHVDISEAKSAWFGESEKRIKKIFTSYRNNCKLAERKGELIPILLFNEADAIISKRKNDTSGNCAQTENAIQNIILEELENLKGIFIATTNLASNMDSAFERRFLFKIKFENPSTEAKTSIWMNKLSWLDRGSATEFAREYDFSGGQIDNIVRKIAMNEVITGERPEISDIRDMCKCEKIDNPEGSRRIGFCL
ncbi:ATP-binding protein [uncultured Treponema sp.]|uniref:ATP-binding protein n=1 Tax=uncultured Treponema sp. TaxID=162155 RepID=UPI00260D31AA|nr:ATP-binding protein [uncultured Treponema sp.]